MSQNLEGRYVSTKLKVSCSVKNIICIKKLNILLVLLAIICNNIICMVLILNQHILYLVKTCY